MNVHPSLAESSRRQQDAAAEQWEATYRQMVLFDLAADMELGFFLAYYRNFAIPSIAATLHRNGEIPARPMKRSWDTGIVVYELISSGLDSDRGRSMIGLLNAVHRHVPGTADDFRYVLLTLLVVPVRWTQHHGWRPPSEAELSAATRFYSELGMRMHLPGMPETFPDAEKFFQDYEAAHVARTAAGLDLMDATVQVFQGRLPAPLRPLARPLISAMLDDGRLTEALGLPCANRFSRAALRAGLALRNAAHRRRPLPRDPRFIPGQAGTALYPDGYTLEQIGPVNVPQAATGNELP